MLAERVAQHGKHRTRFLVRRARIGEASMLDCTEQRAQCLLLARVGERCEYLVEALLIDFRHG